MRRLAAALAGLMLAGAAAEAARAAGAEGEEVCADLQVLAAPPADRPAADGATTLAGCSSQRLYYGIGTPADPDAARLCAFAERARGEDGIAGAAMLMTIYANGVGAARDLDLAAAFACEAGGAPAELAGRLEHLQALKAEGPQAGEFHFCDDVTSGYAGGLCAAHAAAFAEAARAERLARVEAGWDPATRAAYVRLLAARDAYVEASAGQEVDLGGTLRAAFVIERQETLKQQFLAVLEALEQVGPLAPEAGGFAAQDARLNDLYRRIMATGESWWGTVTKDGIRATQRLWLRYREAWVAFAEVRAPGVPADALRARLTAQRIAALELFAG